MKDETLDDAEKSYEVNVHNRIMDTAIEAIHRRFLTHSNLYADLACLDPRNFPQLSTSALPQSEKYIILLLLSHITHYGCSNSLIVILMMLLNILLCLCVAP